MTFGRYKEDKTFSDVYEQDPGYFHWFVKASQQVSDPVLKKKNVQADELLKYISDRMKVEPLKETRHFVKNKSTKKSIGLNIEKFTKVAEPKISDK